MVSPSKRISLASEINQAILALSSQNQSSAAKTSIAAPAIAKQKSRDSDLSQTLKQIEYAQKKMDEQKNSAAKSVVPSNVDDLKKKLGF